MQMRPGGSTGRTQPAHDLSDPHALANLNLNRREVTIAGGETIAVVDFNHLAVAPTPSGMRDDARGCGVDRLTLFAAEIDARVHGRAVQERIKPNPEPRRQFDFPR